MGKVVLVALAQHRHRGSNITMITGIFSKVLPKWRGQTHFHSPRFVLPNPKIWGFPWSQPGPLLSPVSYGPTAFAVISCQGLPYVSGLGLSSEPLIPLSSGEYVHPDGPRVPQFQHE